MLSYLTVDYERRNFSVNQNSWTTDAAPQLVSIPAVTHIPAVTDQKKPHSVVGSIAGATSGAVIAAVATVVALILLWRRKKMKQTRKEGVSEDKKGADETYYKPEMDGIGKVQGELDGTILPREAGGQPKFEMLGSVFDLGQPAQHHSEVEGSRWGTELIGSLGGVETGEGEVTELEHSCNRWSMVNDTGSIPKGTLD